MGRKRRPYLPGAIFHLTARTIRMRHWLTGRLRTAGLRLLAEVAPRSRMRLLAVAFMPNHLHIVAQQGDRPLSALMQPLLRGLANQIHDAHNLRGPVFWRHYASRPCLDPTHARNAIVYTHLNPVRAGLCDDPADYRWTSHALYVEGDGSTLPAELRRLAPVLEPRFALPLYALGPDRRLEEMRDDYRVFVDWRIRADAEGVEDTVEWLPGSASTGWPYGTGFVSLSPLFHDPVGQGTGQIQGADRGPYAPDLATLAGAALAAEDPTASLESIRGRGGGRGMVRLRHLVIRRLSAAGHRNIDIARFLDLAESTVSDVIRKPKNGAPSV